MAHIISYTGRKIVKVDIPIERRLDETPMDFLIRLHCALFPCVGFRFTRKGALRLTQMFPELSNNYKRMHGKKPYRRPLKNRRLRKNLIDNR